MYFVVGNDYAVWQSDGTTAGTVSIILQNTSNPVYSLNNGFQFSEYKGELYFSGSCNTITIGFELCKLTTALLPLSAFSFTGEMQKQLKRENTGIR